MTKKILDENQVVKLDDTYAEAYKKLLSAFTRDGAEFYEEVKNK